MSVAPERACAVVVEVRIGDGNAHLEGSEAFDHEPAGGRRADHADAHARGCRARRSARRASIGSRPRRLTVPVAVRNTSLAIITIAAKVNSATGTALAAAALDTTTPCSHVAGVTVCLTLPAA